MEDKSGRESKKRLWDTGRYLVGCLLLLCMAGKSYAQGDDFGVWTSAEVKKKIFSGFDASLEGEFRTRDGLQTVERWSGSAGVSYKMFRWLKASAGYTFIHYYHPMEVTKKGNYIPEYWQPKHRVNLSLTGKVDWRRFTFSLRERWQYTYRPSQSVPKFDGDDGSVKNDEYISGKGKNVLRSRLQVEYNIRKCAFTPYTSCELSYSLNEIGAFEKLRWTLGTEWKLSKKHALDFYYLYQNKADVGCLTGRCGVLQGEETRKKPKETERILEKVFVFGHQKRSDFVALSAVLGESGRICNGLCGNARLFHT